MITRAPKDVSPRASGPAGGTFEAHVATHYALALLAQTEARGLPGVLIDRIEFQRSGQGHPLDDIIVKGPANGSGVRRVLEVQAKRSMAFTQGDGNFKDIMRGVVAGWKVDPDRRFAVAIERTSGPIENGVQETLELARNTTDYDSYNKLLNTPGRSNKLMVNFHAVFRKHLSDNGVAEDHEVHAILKAFFVLHFDYGRAGSSAEYHDRSRASALIATDMLGDPYDTLFHCILEADAIGGDVDRSQLVCWLHDRGISTSEAPRLVSARNHIEEMSRLALARIHTSVGGFTLLRDDRLRSLEDALFVAGTDRQTVEITGPSGVGKSALMKAVVERRSATARCLVLSPDRTPSGGWAVLRTTFGIDASPEVFLADLAETVGAVPHEIGINPEPDDPWLSRLGASAFLARFASEQQLAAIAPQLKIIFDQALAHKSPTRDNLRYDVMYSPQALAISGLAYFTARKLLDEPPSDLMKAVAEFPKDAAAVFSRHRAATVEINLASLESIIRIGLHACISIRQQGYDENTEVFSTREATLISEREERMAAECAWLAGNDGEPAWPAAPARRVKRPQRVLRLPGGQARTTVVRTDHKWPDRYFDNQTAAVWSDFVARDPRLVETAGRNLFLANADWLLATNKPAETDEDDGDIERVWTRALFECAAAGAKLWTPDDRHRLVFDLLNQFADEAFIDAAAAFLVKSDLLNIERGHADRVYLLSLRESIWSRLQKTSQWQRHLWSTRGGMEIHLKELIAAFFFKISYGFGQETSYTKGLEGAPMIPFLPLLTDIASAAPGCPMIAHLFLHVGELVGGDAAESYLLRAAEQWVVKCDERFWGEYGVGRKLCLLAMESDLGATPEAWLEIGDRAASAGVAEGENLKHRLLALLTNRVTGN